MLSQGPPGAAGGIRASQRDPSAKRGATIGPASSVRPPPGEELLPGVVQRPPHTVNPTRVLSASPVRARSHVIGRRSSTGITSQVDLLTVLLFVSVSSTIISLRCTSHKMPPFGFVHAADLHLDTPFAMIGRVAPEIAARLRDASLEAFDALVRMAIEREAAFVIFAGDIYDCASRGVPAQFRFLRGD